MGSYPPSPGFPAPSSETAQPELAADPAQQAELRAVLERLPTEENPDGSRSAAKPGSRSWAYAPATYVLLGINCAVFIAMLLNHISWMAPTAQQLVDWGATDSMKVLYSGQWFRIITAMFVHVGIVHLATNMWCLWNLGLLGEPLLGPFGVFAAYILAGAAGNLLSISVNLAFGVNSVGAGASGAVFGLAGVLIVLLKSPRLPIPPKELRGLRRYVIYFAAINFVVGFGGNFFFSSVQVDNWAHLGGFLGGILFALPLVPMLGSPKPLFLFRRRVATGLLSGVLIFFGYFISVVFPVR